MTTTRLHADPLAFCAEEVARLEKAELRRRVRSLDSGSEPEVVVDGRRLLHLASNNYLGLATHPEVTAAASDAALHWGAGSGSARLITGGFRLHEELEAALARLKSCPDAVLFSSGYLANLGTISALVDRDDAVFSDALNHASIIDGARLSRAEVAVYEHADAGHLESLLSAWRRSRPRQRALVVTDSVFSMDGDLAPLPDLLEACRRHGAILMVDEAHATGVVGPGGRGAVAHFALEGKVPVVMGTLSKALGAAGGFVAGSEALCDFLRNRARSFIFDTATAPPAAAAARAALGVLERDPARPERARALARRLAGGLAAAGYPVDAPAAAIVPVVVGAPGAALRLSAALLDEGILVTAIRPPSVPPGTARLRATVMATHTDEQLDGAVEKFAALRRNR
jgi:glycine C-acetyltransferase/8-amino-7-oxononanoate synthase